MHATSPPPVTLSISPQQPLIVCGMVMRKHMRAGQRAGRFIRTARHASMIHNKPTLMRFDAGESKRKLTMLLATWRFVQRKHMVGLVLRADKTPGRHGAFLRLGINRETDLTCHFRVSLSHRLSLPAPEDCNGMHASVCPSTSISCSSCTVTLLFPRITRKDYTANKS